MVHLHLAQTRTTMPITFVGRPGIGPRRHTRRRLCVGSLHANARHAGRRCRCARGRGVSRRARLGCVLRLPDHGRGTPLDRGRNRSMQRRTASGAEPRDGSRDRPRRTPWGAHHHLEQPARLDVRFVSVKPTRPRVLTRHPRHRHTRPDQLAGSLGFAGLSRESQHAALRGPGSRSRRSRFCTSPSGGRSLEAA